MHSNQENKHFFSKIIVILMQCKHICISVSNSNVLHVFCNTFMSVNLQVITYDLYFLREILYFIMKYHLQI